MQVGEMTIWISVIVIIAAILSEIIFRSKPKVVEGETEESVEPKHKGILVLSKDFKVADYNSTDHVLVADSLHTTTVTLPKNSFTPLEIATTKSPLIIKPSAGDVICDRPKLTIVRDDGKIILTPHRSEINTQMTMWEVTRPGIDVPKKTPTKLRNTICSLGKN